MFRIGLTGPADSRWYGAWWLGFLLGVALMVPAAVVVLGFPRRLPRTYVQHIGIAFTCTDDVPISCKAPVTCKPYKLTFVGGYFIQSVQGSHVATGVQFNQNAHHSRTVDISDVPFQVPRKK